MAAFFFCIAVASAEDWRTPLLPTDEAWKSAPQHFTFNNESEPETLDPGRATGVLEHRLLDSLFEGLTTHDPKSLQPRPGVAESWTVGEDGLQWTFHLRADARWSDGRPVTAQDFVDSWIRVLTPATAADYASLLYVIAGAEDFHQGRAADPASIQVRAIDPRTLTVTLHRPCAWFLDLCAFSTLSPVPLAVIAAQGDRWTRPEHIVSNGPFILSAWEPRDRIVLMKSPTYWDRDVVKLETVTALPISDSEAAYKRFLAGDLHWMATLPLAKIDEVRLNPDYYVAPYFGTYFYRLNVRMPPFDCPHLRRAVSYAIDRVQITTQVTRGGQLPVGSLCPPVVGYEPIAGPSYDVAKARAEFAQSKYAGNCPAIEILYNTSDQHKQIAEVVAHQLKDVLGVQVLSRNAEWKTYLAAQNRGEYQMCRASWIGDYADPDTFFAMFRTGDGNNNTGWSDPVYDQLVTAAPGITDPAERWNTYQQAERILVEEGVPIVCLYRYVAQGLLAERVCGWYANIRDVHPLKWVWME